MPLEPIPIPQKLRIDTQSSPMGKSSEGGGDWDTVGEKYELMKIDITVYSLSGLVCSANQRTKRGRRRARLQSMKRLGRRKKKTRGGYKPVNVPTTAVVSCHRNVYSSVTSIETYLPSEVLKKPLAGSNLTLKQTAVWQYSEGTSWDCEDGARCTTFTLTRVMQRQSYVPDEKVSQIDNYFPETIDINISVGRGKDLVPLAVASIVVTGDEESETFLNVTVKPPEMTKSKKGLQRYSWSSGKTKPACFTNDPDYSYSLEENAVLRVGVKATPKEEHCSPAKCKRSRKKTLDEILAGMYDDNVILELNDENSLLDELVRCDSPEAKPLKPKGNEPLDHKEMQAPCPKPIFAEYLCGSMSTLFEDENQQPTTTEAENPPEIKTPKPPRTTSAVVLPLSLMSSVSESTMSESFQGSLAFR